MKKNVAPVDRKRWFEVIPPFSWVMILRQRLKIGPKLVIGFGILIILMVGGYGLGIYAGVNATNEINLTTNFRAPLTLAASRAQTNWLEMDASIQAYLAFGDEAYKVRYEEARQEFEKNLNDLDTILSSVENKESPDFKQSAETLEEVRYYYNAWIKLTPQLFEVRDDQLQREPALKILLKISKRNRFNESVRLNERPVF